jgi:hypothetical protein
MGLQPKKAHFNIVKIAQDGSEQEVLWQVETYSGPAARHLWNLHMGLPKGTLLPKDIRVRIKKE